MSAPVATLPTDTGVLGPGQLKIGDVGSGQLDVSCYLSQAGIPVNTTTGDSKKVLCGATRPGSTSTEFSLDIDIDLDLANESGLLAKSWAVADGGPDATQDFVFIPNNELGVSVSGQLVLTPLPMNKVAYGEDLVASVSFVIVGTPLLSYDVVAAATGATAGTPGTFTPAGAAAPANLAALTGLVASPASAWTTGQHVITADAVHAYWTGTAWASGDAAVLRSSGSSKQEG